MSKILHRVTFGAKTTWSLHFHDVCESVFKPFDNSFDFNVCQSTRLTSIAAKEFFVHSDKFCGSTPLARRFL